MADILYVEDGYWDEDYAQAGIDINWATRTIFVPIQAMTLTQSSPTVIYTLNLNEFRLALKALEQTPAGMVAPDTHRHNTEVSVGGVTLARVIEIINGYIVEFENGQYAVNLVGANSNVGDRVVVNNVSVRSANSAGLTSSPLTAQDVRVEMDANSTRLFEIDFKTTQLDERLTPQRAGFLDRIPMLLTVAKFLGLK